MPRRAKQWLVTVSVIGLAAGLSGCGGARHKHSARARVTRRSHQMRGPYRWLVATTGPPPSIAVENRFPGSRGWRLPGPAKDVGGRRRGDVTGYVAEEAVSPGQTQRIYVSAPGSSKVRIDIFRMGWYRGRGGREVLTSDALRLVPQPPCAHHFATGLTECAWHPTLSFAIPPALPTGVYIARLSARSGQSDCLFVVLSAVPQPLLAQLASATYEAYNAWGGDSLYPGGRYRVGVTRSRQGVEVSFRRPYDSITGAGQFFARDVAMIWFLERYGYPVSYTTSASVDGNPGQLQGHRGLIDFGHSEYWSQRQADAFAAARNAGTSLLFLSSDTLAWRVRYTDADQALISYKQYARRDPDRAQPTGRFPGGGASLTGSSYRGCITPRLSGSGPPRYRYYAWTPGPRLQPRWLFAGTGIRPATRISGIVGYEVDMRTPGSPRGTELLGAGTALCMTPEPGNPSPGAGQSRAETTLYTAASGALVFATGTLGWELALEPVPSASPDAPHRPDLRVVAMTRNLLGRVLSGPAGGR